MTTLLVLTVNGEVVSRCDARCYGANWDKHCQCVCLGRNHGVGLVKARNTAITDLDELTREAKKKHGPTAELECRADAIQLSLFGGLDA
jgi:hypothetical protein